MCDYKHANNSIYLSIVFLFSYCICKVDWGRKKLEQSAWLHGQASTAFIVWVLGSMIYISFLSPFPIDSLLWFTLTQIVWFSFLRASGRSCEVFHSTVSSASHSMLLAVYSDIQTGSDKKEQNLGTLAGLAFSKLAKQSTI